MTQRNCQNLLFRSRSPFKVWPETLRKSISCRTRTDAFPFTICSETPLRWFPENSLADQINFSCKNDPEMESYACFTGLWSMLVRKHFNNIKHFWGRKSQKILRLKSQAPDAQNCSCPSRRSTLGSFVGACFPVLIRSSLPCLFWICCSCLCEHLPWFLYLVFSSLFSQGLVVVLKKNTRKEDQSKHQPWTWRVEASTIQRKNSNILFELAPVFRTVTRLSTHTREGGPFNRKCATLSWIILCTCFLWCSPPNLT